MSMASPASPISPILFAAIAVPAGVGSCGFVGAAVAPGTRVITEGFDGYVDLSQDFRHYSVIQGGAELIYITEGVRMLA